jgi:hypothetical protein
MKNKCVLLIVILGLMMTCRVHAVPADVTFTPSSKTAEIFEFMEVTLTVAAPDAANPFTDVVVAGEFGLQAGSPLKLDGFCDAADGSLFQYQLGPRQ